MHTRALRIAAALLLATLGTVVLVKYVDSARKEAVAAESLVKVLRVKTKIDKGTAAADIERLVERVDVPAKVRAADAVNELQELTDLHATVDLLPGEQLVKARFANAGTATRGEAPPGLLQVTVPLSPERALGGNVRAGDTVGVILSFGPGTSEDGTVKTGNSTHLELHKVLITDVQLQSRGKSAVGDGGDDEKKQDDGVGRAESAKYLITLAIDAPAVEQVVFAAEHGKIWLSAEPKDAPEGGAKVVGRHNVYTDDDK